MHGSTSAPLSDRCCRLYDITDSGIFFGKNYPYRELVCAVKDGLPDELEKYLMECPADNMQILLKTENNANLLTRWAPFTKDCPIPETGAVYYLWKNGACKAPVRSFLELGLQRL